MSTLKKPDARRLEEIFGARWRANWSLALPTRRDTQREEQYQAEQAPLSRRCLWSMAIPVVLFWAVFVAVRVLPRLQRQLFPLATVLQFTASRPTLARPPRVRRPTSIA